MTQPDPRDATIARLTRERDDARDGVAHLAKWLGVEAVDANDPIGMIGPIQYAINANMERALANAKREIMALHEQLQNARRLILAAPVQIAVTDPQGLLANMQARVDAAVKERDEARAVLEPIRDALAEVLTLIETHEEDAAYGTIETCRASLCRALGGG